MTDTATAAAPALKALKSTRKDVRQDHGTARRIYRAQAIQRAFGPAAARAFMRACRIAPPLAARILSASVKTLRR